MNTFYEDHRTIEVLFHAEPTPTVSYESGLAFYEEHLLQGRFVGGSHSTSGRLKNSSLAYGLRQNVLGRCPIEAFHLNIDGFTLSSHWRWIGEITTIPSNQTDIRHTVVELEHELRPVRVKVHTRLDGSSFFVRWLKVTNTGNLPAALAEIAPWSGLLWHSKDSDRHLPAGMASPFTLGGYRDTRPLHEGAFSWQALDSGTSTLSSCNGHSGWGLPFAILRNEANGEVAIAHLAWSGNWTMEFLLETAGLGSTVWDDAFTEGAPPHAALFCKLGLTAPAPQRLIAPGETVSSPQVHLGFLHTDLDAAIQELHAHLRGSVFVPQPPERTLLVGAGRVVEKDEAWMQREIAVAAELGCEYFLVDAGWYGHKAYDWSTTVGDWNVGDWLPHGLQGLRATIQQHGMLFGLWMEPEAIGSDSWLLRDHPDWQLQRNDQPVARALNLAREDVARWLEGEITRVIREHQLDILKIDYNTSVAEGGLQRRDDRFENTLWRHYETLYAILDRLHEQFPHLAVEGCASGGGRNDLGLASRVHVCSISDWAVPPRSLLALNNVTLALPPEHLRYYFGHEIGVSHEYGDMDFQLRIVLFANPIFVGFGPNRVGISATQCAVFKRYIDLYKRVARPILPTCRVFHHTPAQSLAEIHSWCVLEYAAPDGSQGYAGLFRLSSQDNEVYHFHPRGLNPRWLYQVTWDNSNNTYEMSGAQLMQEGLLVRLTSPFTSELLLFQRADSSSIIQ